MSRQERRDDLFDRIDACDRGEKIALSMALWQNGEMHLDGPDTLAHVAVEHLRDRGWHNPVMAQSMKDSFNRLWRGFLMVAVVAVLSLAEVLWMASR